MNNKNNHNYDNNHPKYSDLKVKEQRKQLNSVQVNIGNTYSRISNSNAKYNCDGTKLKIYNWTLYVDIIVADANEHNNRNDNNKKNDHQNNNMIMNHDSNDNFNYDHYCDVIHYVQFDLHKFFNLTKLNVIIQ